MSRTRIKICGVTRVDDALAAAELGADAVGLVRVPGTPRCVADAIAAEIVDALPAFVTPVMLFADESPSEMIAAARAFGIGTIQLHGREELLTASGLEPLRVIKALRVTPERIRFELTQWRRIGPANLVGIVLESPVETGGSGVVNNWDLIRRLRDENYLDPLMSPPIIFAGGLDPKNVAAIVREFQPYAVDVSSGVEDGTKGIKSRAKIADFIAAVSEASKADS
ncbi:MAG TPA: phosphoribosylanthranilate isomerase [Tepidisphaeraceae bacterium]|nr:phosphoribosylanthranilate isomerase [Tepidisphaeraceae bacterium]